MVEMTVAAAINAGLRVALGGDEKVLLTGEDVGKLGGVYRVTQGLQEEFGVGRVFDSPLGESGIVGTAIGLALRGYRTVCEIQFDGFVYPAFNQITSQLAKLHYRSGGSLLMPVVVRVPYGGGIGSIEHHSESPEVLFAHTAGLRVVSPSNAHDAYWMIQQAVLCDDPVIFFEPKRRYWLKGEVDVVESGLVLDQAVNVGGVVAVGGVVGVSLVTYGALVPLALAVAEFLRGEVVVEVIDLRSISPLDFSVVLESVLRTGRLVVAHEAAVFAGIGAEIAAWVVEEAFYVLEAAPLRVGGFHLPYPVSKVEQGYVPDFDRLLDAVWRSVRF